MAKTISALPAAAQATDADELEVSQGGSSRKVTRAQLVTGLAIDSHGHALADITDAGALAGRDSVGSPEIDTGAVTPAKLDRGYAELGHTHAAATSSSDGYMSAADKAKLDGVQVGAEANRAVASQVEAEAGIDNVKGMTPLRTAQAITALTGSHNHTLADITDAGGLAGLDEAGIAELSIEAQSRLLPDPTGQLDGKVAKVMSGAWVVADDQVGEPGSGEANTGTNVGTDGVGPFAGKVGTELQFRSIASLAPAITVTLDDAENDIDLDLVEGQIDHDALLNFAADEHIDHSAIQIGAQHSLEGGGDITTTRTLNLVGDVASPGANQVYGTDGAGVRGWKADPSGSSYNFEADGADYSVTAFEVATDGAAQDEERQFTNTAGTNLINFPAGIPADSFGYFSLGADAAAEIRCPSGVTVNGQDDRGGANPTIVVHGLCWWRLQGADTVRLDGAIEVPTDVWGAKTFKQAATFEQAPVVPDASFSIAKISAIGTPDSMTFLRGDGAWAELPAGSGDTQPGRIDFGAVPSHELDAAEAVYLNVRCHTGQDNQRINVPAAPAREYWWQIIVEHDSCEVGITGDPAGGTIDGVDVPNQSTHPLKQGVVFIGVTNTTGPVVVVAGSKAAAALGGQTVYGQQDRVYAQDWAANTLTKAAHGVDAGHDSVLGAVLTHNGGAGTLTVDDLTDGTASTGGSFLIHNKGSGALAIASGTGLTLDATGDSSVPQDKSATVSMFSDGATRHLRVTAEG